MKTQPSKLTYGENVVEKTYTLDRYIKNFKNEVDILKNFKSKYCIKAWDITRNGYKMERLNFSLGNGQGLNEDSIRRILFSISIDHLMLMLDDILLNLKKFNIKHRDLNPGNMLWSEKEKTLKLIDFFWSEFENSPAEIPDYANPLYTQNDDKAIEMIKSGIKDLYKKIEKELQESYNYFINNVGKGPYQDGSSSSLGRAYHIVDIPYFRDKIEYSKDTCLREYGIIKDNLPIKPKSFLDIGCANGYFTFNLLRDFDIKYCRSFERDKSPFNFLQLIKKNYRLNELSIDTEITDKIKIDKIYDVTIFLNSHMWVYKQLGKERTFNIVKNIISKSKYMFFQTAGSYSRGRYRIEEYKNREDIERMLRDAGGSVEYMGTTEGKHNAPRDMFLVRNNGKK